MKNERTLNSDTIKSNGMITTIILTVNDENGEYFRYIKSTDPDWDGRELGFNNRTEAEKRYEADLAHLKGETPPKTATYGLHKLSRKDYIKATIDERVLPAATDELHEQAVDMLNNTAEVISGSDKAINAFIVKTESEMIDELIVQLTDYKKNLKD